MSGTLKKIAAGFAVALLFATIATGCSKSSRGGGGGGGSNTIGPNGGTVIIQGGTLDGASVTATQGATSTTVVISIQGTTRTITVPNSTVIGPFVDFGTTQFNQPVTVTLPFDIAQLEPGMTGENVFVVIDNGGVNEVIPVTVNLTTGRLSFQVTRLGIAAVFKRNTTRQLVITSATPARVNVNAPFSPPLTVQQRNEAGALTADNLPVTATLTVVPTVGAVLNGTKTISQSTATFTDLNVSAAGTGFRLDFTCPGCRKASFTFDVVALSALAFSQQPANAGIGAAIPSVIVKLVDGLGNTVNVNQNVTLTIGNNPNGGNLGGTTTVASIAGIASFNDLSIDRVGTGYTLVASSGTLPNVTSTPFNITSTARSGTGLGWALTATNKLVGFNLVVPGRIEATVHVTVPDGGAIKGLDFRPANGGLYALWQGAGRGRLYTIDLATGSMTRITPTDFALPGTNFGFDFNPTVDRIRVLSDSGGGAGNPNNMRLHPDTGLVAFVDGDQNGSVTAVTHCAYTNNFNGATTTQLFGIDTSGADTLVLFSSPNTGVNGTPFPVTMNPGAVGGFDIVGTGALSGGATTLNVGYLVATPGAATVSTLFRVDLTNGNTTSVGTVGVEEIVTSFAIDNATLYGLAQNGTLLSFDAGRPQTVTAAVTLTGVPAGEFLTGIDVRPATGVLYATSNGAKLYTVNPATGVCTAVSSVPFGAVTTVGVDFNPVPDLLRVIADTDQNFRISPVTGQVAGADGAINPVANTVTAVAYNNNFAGATAPQVTLYGIDPVNDVSVTFTSPNAGTLSATQPTLGVNITDQVGYDISTAEVGYASLNIATTTTSALYVINTAAAANSAQLIGNFGTTQIIRGLACALPSVPTLVGLTTNSSIVMFGARTPTLLFSNVPITGLINPASETCEAIDYRPANGVLYLLTKDGGNGRVYTLNAISGVASHVSAVAGATFGAVPGTFEGFDFNPVPDRIRVVTDFDDTVAVDGNNFRVHPDTGALAGTDTDLTANQRAIGAAYTDIANVNTTTLYILRDETGGARLARQGGVNSNPSPNGGVLTDIGVANFSPFTSRNLGFDIARGGVAYASIHTGAAVATDTEIWIENLADGTALRVGQNAAAATVAGGVTLRGLTVKP